MPVAGPFYLAMVDETETTFGVEHHRMDEYVFAARRILAEGEKPKLELMIENPRVGLLAATRKQHCWFAWDSNWGGTPNIIPLFFGRIVGIPSDVQSETITVTFISWPTNYKKQLQQLAETLKVAPFYDPVFTDVSRRDDPLAIFESHSKMVCVDPVTGVVSASDILDAEDGNADFTADDHFYDSLHVSPGAIPKTVIHVDMSVSWTQTARGYVDMGNNVFVTLTGDGLIGEWPKPLSSIADGLTVFSATARDDAGIGHAVTSTYSGSWQNKEKHHADGDALSFSFNATSFRGSFGTMVTYHSQNGSLDPFAVDSDGDPSPVNIPMSLSTTGIVVPTWVVSTSLVVEYNAARPHTERVIFNLFADVQPTTVNPVLSDDSETLNLSGVDVGVPIFDLLNWTTVSGQHVDVGVVVFPDDPHLPGNDTAQIVTVAGTTGEVEPDFSSVVGDTTVDGTATWASLGVATPPANATNWSGVSHVSTGTIILPQRPLFVTYAAFVKPGQLSFPPTGTSISVGTYLKMDDGSFKVCTQAGVIGGGGGPAAVLTTTGMPSGKTYYIAKTGGLTGAQYVIPNFDETLYAITNDNMVVWVAIGTAEIPIGGTVGDVTSSTYFGQHRGEQSIAYGICRARARLRFASRCVTSQFQCSYLRGAALTLRKSATLHDYRLPGGIVLGKITGTELIADASSGTFTCNATIQSSVGLDTAISEVAGEPSYVDDDYVEDDYQSRISQIVILPEISDVGYSPLVPVADEDGITFPLTKDMFVISEAFMSAGSQSGAVAAGVASMKASVQISAAPTNDQQARADALAVSNSNGIAEQLKRTPAWYDLVMKPINGNGSFNHVYHVTCTVLSLPKMIDLQEVSTS